MDSISEAASVREIRGILKNSSWDLSDLYRATFDRIKRSKHSKIAQRALLWASHSQRTLTINEFRHALAIEHDSTELDPESLMRVDLTLSACMGLLACDNGYFGLVHLTAYEFFSNHLDQHEMFLSCLTCLQYNRALDGPCENVEGLQSKIEQIPLLDYSGKYWHEHVSNEAASMKQIQALINNGKQLASTTQIFYYKPYSDSSLRSSTFNSIPKDRTAAHVASLAGLPMTLGALLDSNDCLSIDSEGFTPLHLAAMFGRTECMRKLLTIPEVRKRSLNLRDNTGWTPIFWSAMKGHLTAVDILVDEGADISLLDKQDWSVIDWVAFKDEPEVIERLLRSKTLSDVESQAGRYHRHHPVQIPTSASRSLRVSASQGSHAAFATLADYFGNRLDSDESDEETITKGVVRRGRRGRRRSTETVAETDHMHAIVRRMQFFRSAGPEIDHISIFDRRESTLMTAKFTLRLFEDAIRNGSIEVVQCLLESTDCLAKYMQRDRWHRTPLHVAAFCPHAAMTHLLLRHGATPIADDNDTTPLDIACRVGSQEVIEALLAAATPGVNCLRYIWYNFSLLPKIWERINQRTYYGGQGKPSDTSVDIYSSHDVLQQMYDAQVTIAEQLIQPGTSISDEQLRDAMACGNIRGFRLLLNHGGQIETLDESERSMLHHAAESSRNGSDGFDTPHHDGHDDAYNNLCRWQRFEYRLENLELDAVGVAPLLELGAPIDQQSPDGRTALYYALSPDEDFKSRAKPKRQPMGWHEPSDRSRQAGNFQQAEILLLNGANPKICTQSGLNGFHFLAASPGLTEDETMRLFNLMPHSAELTTEAASLRQVKMNDTKCNNAASIAIVFGKLKLMLEILKCGATFPTEDVLTRALRLAIERGDIPTFRWLAQHGAKMEQNPLLVTMDHHKYNFNTSGFRQDDEQHAQTILESVLLNGSSITLDGTDPVHGKSEDGGNMLHAAMTHGCHEAFVDKLLDQGLDPREKDDHGHNVLHLAVARINISDAVVHKLISRGVDVKAVDDQGQNMLHKAVDACRPTPFIQELIDLGVDLLQRDQEGFIPAGIARRWNRTRWVDCLGEAGSKQGICKRCKCKKHNGQFVWSTREASLQAASHEGKVEMVRMLLNHGADVNSQSNRYGNALHAASYGGHMEVVQILLDRGAEINAPSSKYGNALHAASAGSKSEVFQTLLDRGAEHTMTDHLGRSILHQAATGTSSTFLASVLEIVQDIDRQDSQDWTPSHWAAYFGQSDTVDTLISAGANMHATDWQGWTPYQLASFAGYTDVCEIIRRRVDINSDEIRSPRAGSYLRGDCDSCSHVSQGSLLKTEKVFRLIPIRSFSRRNITVYPAPHHLDMIFASAAAGMHIVCMHSIPFSSTFDMEKRERQNKSPLSGHRQNLETNP